VASRLTMGLGEIGEKEVVLVSCCDEPVGCLEVIHHFDPEEVDAALAELDRLHAELAEG